MAEQPIQFEIHSSAHNFVRKYMHPGDRTHTVRSWQVRGGKTHSILRVTFQNRDRAELLLDHLYKKREQVKEKTGRAPLPWHRAIERAIEKAMQEQDGNGAGPALN